MGSTLAIWRLFLLVSVLTFPQVLGALAYLYIRQYLRLAARLVGVLLPPTVFFYFAWMHGVYLPSKTHANEACGMAALAAAVLVLLSTCAQLVTSLMIQLTLHLSQKVNNTGS